MMTCDDIDGGMGVTVRRPWEKAFNPGSFYLVNKE